jgi:hypothetical protein
MKLPLFKDACRPVLSCRVAESANGPPARACFAPKWTSRAFAVRGSAAPGPCARRCSPPTAMPTSTRTVRKSIALALSRARKVNASERQRLIRLAKIDNSHAYRGTDWTNGSFVHSETQEILIVRRRKGCSVIRRPIHDHIWPKPPPRAVNVLLALFPLRSTLTAAAFRPGLLLGSGFGEFKAGALLSHRTHLLLSSNRTAGVSAMAIEDAAAAAIATIRQIKQNRWLFRLFLHIPVLPAVIGSFPPLPFAFSVVFLASADGRRNICCGVAALDAASQVMLLLALLRRAAHCNCSPQNRPPINCLSIQPLLSRWLFDTAVRRSMTEQKLMIN